MKVKAIGKPMAAGFAKTLLLGGLLLATLSSASAFNNLKPLHPQPSADMLKPGLAVTYYGAKFNSITQLLEWMDYEDGKPGEPIPMLNYQVGQGNILTTTATDLMGADIRGLINFDKVGTYTVMVHSNDGVRVTIGGVMIHEDPEVHADRFSEEIKLEISEPGWYPVHILYFEKKNTATLELYWDPPGPEEIDYVPASAFAHTGNE
ncbi:PA14 domain-containing protein [Sneathiella glossodoripedis]|uniref:PA14 domain-containing protein n=1 Tax=Sneathiella glossodoripedis TaxID=418853 RepID=UPI0004711228|nr:PA14 domain-containing protein [Sneathiella glossodoripedis]